MKLIEKLNRLDPRIIYVMIALAVIIPLLKPFYFPMDISSPVKLAYDTLDKLPPGSKVLFSFDFGPATKPECFPAAVAMLRHSFSKDLKVVAVALWPEGSSFAEEALEMVGKEYNKVYGIDYVNLGYKAGDMDVIQRMVRSLGGAFPKDLKGKPIEEYPIMDGVKNLSSFKAILDFSGGFPGMREYVNIAEAQTNVPLMGSATAVIAPEYYTFLNSGQLSGLLGGMKGAAEYEELIGKRGFAFAGMDAQSISHLLIVILVIFANIFYLLAERKKKGAGL